MSALEKKRIPVFDLPLVGAGLAAVALAGSLLTGGIAEQAGDVSRAVPTTPRRQSVGLVTGMPMYDSALSMQIVQVDPNTAVTVFASCQAALNDTGRDTYVLAIVPNSSNDGIAKSLDQIKMPPARECTRALKLKFPNAKVCALSNDPLGRKGLKTGEPIYSATNPDLRKYTDAGSVFDCYIGVMTYEEDIQRIFGNKGVSGMNQSEGSRRPVSKAHRRPAPVNS
jgi:hypothetical protein